MPRLAPYRNDEDAINGDGRTHPIQLFAPPAGAGLSYEGDLLPFYFRVRKEVFAPNEVLENPTAIDLVFQQIVSDVLSRRVLHPRIAEKEHSDMNSLFDNFNLLRFFLIFLSTSSIQTVAILIAIFSHMIKSK